MFEVIPNWHPLFVHFSIALLSMSTIFFVALIITKNNAVQDQLKILAYWNLWLGTGFAIVTATAGWFAYNSVAHDTPSHEAMTDHRNWALVTLSVFIVASLWSIKQYKSVKNTSATFTFIMVMAFVLLASTGWRGGEAVYRYGLGVMSLPKAEGDGHAHEHSNNKNPSPESHKDIVSDQGKNEHKHSGVEMQSSESHKDAVDDHDKNPHTH